jgi:hypothetical protein
MAVGLNYYFRRRLFDGVEDFQRKQMSMVVRFGIKIDTPFSRGMIDRVQVHNKIYRRKTVFSTIQHRRDSWDYRLVGNHRRAIIDYWPIGGNDYHIEAIELSGDKFIFPKHIGLATLPRTNLTLEQYIDLCFNPNDLAVYLGIYIYIQ